MNKYRIVHIINNDKFIKPFIDFVVINFDSSEHLFIFMYGSNEKNIPIPEASNIININNIYTGKKNILKLSRHITPYIEHADKVILHGIFSFDLINYLFLNKKYLQKCYWVIWGGDLYSHVIFKKTLRTTFYRYRKKAVIKNIGGLVTYIKGDYELAQDWYGANGKYHECFMYPSNLYKEYKINKKQNKTTNILVGNSATLTNNHFDAFSKLEKYKDQDVKVIVPLSYGNEVYTKKVINKGRKIFGDKFVPLIEFMQFDQYLDLLSDIDIAIFNHNRQQAMGNIITLLGLGKKVYMRSDITPWEMLKDIGIDVFDIADFSIIPLENDVKKQNKNIIKEFFSEENYLKQLNTLFES